MSLAIALLLTAIQPNFSLNRFNLPFYKTFNFQMKEDNRLLLLISKRLIICLLMTGSLIGCTSLVANMTIEPYTKVKPMRNSVEQVAEEFCSNKRASSGATIVAKQPDYIFTTDGCTRWFDDSWVACCIVHDISYWCGGSEQDRKEADRELKQCVNSKMNMMGNILYVGVKLGGHPWLPTPWRWGYGWDDWPKSYEKPGASLPVKKLIEKLKIYDIIDKQLRDFKK